MHRVDLHPTFQRSTPRARRPVAFAAAAAAALACVLLVWSPASSATPASVAASSAQASYPTWIPAALVDGYGPGPIRHAFQRGSVVIRTARREVRIDWDAGSDVNVDPATARQSSNPYVDDGQAHESQTFGTRYFPLNSAVIDERRIVVIGVHASQQYLIELWALGWPAAMPAPALPVGGSEPQSVSVVLPQRTVQRLELTGLPASGFVAAASVLRPSSGPPTHALLLFRPTQAVYRLELATGQCQLVASPTQPCGLLTPIPELAQHYFRNIAGQHHATQGFVYFLTCPESSTIPLAERAPVIVLRDANMNGDIDSHLVVSSQQFYATGSWWDSSQYVDWWR